MALTILNVGILAIVASFNSGMLALRRAATVSTAASLADAQMELYRALKYGSIYLDVDTATDSIYQADSALQGTPAPTKVLADCGVPPLANECNPSRTAVGADGKTYRVDSFVVYHTPLNGRVLKKVTVVVRSANGATAYVRIASTFDASTGA